jgi:alkanesulfonate monooxygenase SsuD/methylene tetrahydromethanopterin reductase-like flavin-dependent oxidoreductase (luciferase family)
MTRKPMYGVLLPHFGEHATPRRMIDAARKVEAYGFDSIWVRDHLTYHPHAYESTNERITLGTAALIPHRHPLLTAQQLANITQFLGPNRLIIGFGIGGYGFEMDNVGLAGLNLPDVHREQVEIMRRVWTGDEIDFDGAFYHFQQADVYPPPRPRVRSHSGTAAHRRPPSAARSSTARAGSPATAPTAPSRSASSGSDGWRPRPASRRRSPARSPSPAPPEVARRAWPA